MQRNALIALALCWGCVRANSQVKTLSVILNLYVIQLIVTGVIAVAPASLILDIKTMSIF